MQHTPLQTPTAFCGWGQGLIDNNIKRILQTKSYKLENPKLYEFEELPNPDIFSQFCTSELIQDKYVALRWLASICNTMPSRIILIESQSIKHVGLSTPMFRFHYLASPRSTEFSRYLKSELTIKSPWKADAPTLFYRSAVVRTIKNSQISEIEAKTKIDNLLACLFNSFDFIFDLADCCVYKRKICIDLDQKLSRLRHLDCTLLFDQSNVRQALIDCMHEFEVSSSIADPNIDKIEYLEIDNQKYTKLQKNTVVLNGVIHKPYAAEHNHMLARIKSGKSSTNFIINIPALVSKYVHKKNVDIRDVVPFFGTGSCAKRLEDFYLINAKNRIIESPIAHLDQPYQAVDLIAS